MPKFRVTLTVAGYCRGTKVFEVEAADEETARENWYDGKKIVDETVRDDREHDVVLVEAIND